MRKMRSRNCTREPEAATLRGMRFLAQRIQGRSRDGAQVQIKPRHPAASIVEISQLPDGANRRKVIIDASCRAVCTFQNVDG